ncbi:MAG: L-rhamnose isomerase, partial [Candidatus Poribacteria bacterium]|nr:L-rhamnose isomerase [Candidatus Poribacteria bacterium]
FEQLGAARNAAERLEDAATVHRFTGVAPTVALHIPWDKTDDWEGLKQYAADLSIGIGAINPNVFQDQVYKLGSVCNPSAEVRRLAIDHMLECVDIMKKTGSDLLSLWFADGTNFPGQANFRKRKQWMTEALSEVYDALPDATRMLIEYKFFEPAFYHTDLADWGTAYLMAMKLGTKAQVLVDLGHHPQGTNIEFIVAYLIDEGKLGGFHFNCRKYADDDLTVGSINPQELFLIYTELVAAELDPDTETDIAYMIDQSHNLKPKVEASIQSVCNLQKAYAKALLVDRDALAAAQDAADLVEAESILQRASETDVNPLLEQVRLEMGRDPHPLTAYRKSGYYEKISKARVGGESQGWA